MSYTDKQYRQVMELVQVRLEDIPVNQLMLNHKWFSIASNIHDSRLTKQILWDIVEKLKED